MYKIYKLYWRNKNHSPLSLPYTTHYTLSIPKSCPICTPNPTPTSCSAAYYALSLPYPLFLKAGSARIRGLSQNLIVKDSRAIFKGKSKEDRAIAGESNIPPRLMQRGFEGIQATLCLDSYSEFKMPLKASGYDGLKALDSNQEMVKRNGQECSKDEGLGQKDVERTSRYMYMVQRLRG